MNVKKRALKNNKLPADILSTSSASLVHRYKNNHLLIS